MIVLDTNVVSEQLKPKPSAGVLAWLTQQDPTSITITAISVAESLVGIALMPEGQRRRDLQAAAIEALGAFTGRVLPFDDAAATHYAEIIAMRRARGRPIELHDAMIAAICRHHGATLATRNVRDFDHVGIAVINPWDDAPDQESASSGVR